MAALAVALALGACAKKESGDQRAVVHFWQFWDLAIIEPLVAEFEASHPGVDIEVRQLTWATGLRRSGRTGGGDATRRVRARLDVAPRFSYEGFLKTSRPSTKPSATAS
jgi:ABC-type glycerol-3-phosphate transport system substrate-binding protein